MDGLHDPLRATALITSAGGTYSAAIVACLRDTEGVDVIVAGVDCQESVDAKFILDHFASLNGADASTTGRRLLSICADLSTDIIFPGSEFECLAIGELRDEFAAAGVFVPMPDNQVMKLMANKSSFYRLLDEHNLDSMEFVVVTGKQAVLAAIDDLGYPRRGVIVKPQAGAGSRGTFVITDAPPIPSIRNRNRQYAMCTKDEFTVLCDEWEIQLEGRELMVMPYYPGSIFDVDCLAIDYEPIHIVPRERRYRDPLSPFSEGCVINYDPRVVTLVERAVRELELNNLFDFDVALAADGTPHIIDVSPRMSGSVAATAVAGLNIPAAMVRYQAGLPVSTDKAVDGTYVVPFPAFYQAKPEYSR